MSRQRFLIIAALTGASALVSAQTVPVKVPVPKGLSACKDDDPVASTERQIAPAAGAEYIACFASSEKVSLQGPSRPVLFPVEHAVALSITGGPYTRVDLDVVLTQVRDQWKSFEPLTRQHADYQARLNSLIKGTSSDAQAAGFDSGRPVLVSIDSLDDQRYAVVTIREYVTTIDGEQVRSIKTDAAAVVLQGSELVRLEIIRQLRAPSDVDEVRTQIAAWSHAVAADAKPTRQ